jgi:hypothetical protein
VDTQTSAAVSAPADEQTELFPVRWGRVLAGLCLVSSAIVGLSYGLPALTDHPLTTGGGEIRRYVDVALEANLPTWWNSALLMAASVLYAVLAWLTHRTRTGGTTAWAVLSALLLLFSLDEATELHERLDRWGVQFVEVARFTYVWLVIGIPLVIVVLVVVVLSARRLPRRSALLVVGGLGTMLAAAVGLEFVGGEIIRTHPEGAGRLFVRVYHLEELLEMVGASIALVAPLAALTVRRVGAAVTVSPLPGSGRARKVHGPPS